MPPIRRLLLPSLLALLTGGTCAAQFNQFRGGGRNRGSYPEGGSIIRLEGGGWVDEDTVQTARETASHSTGTPEWTNPPGFEGDVFTFARIIFRSLPNRADGFRTLGWYVDYPDADLNLSYRLQELTTIRTDPDARVLHLMDATLTKYPFIYMEHVEGLILREDEVSVLRNYLLNGGALLINDFWNIHGWTAFAAEMQRVLPGREWVDLPMDHPIFNCVYHIPGPLQNLRMPTLQFWNRDYDPKDPTSHLSLRDRGEQSEEMHIRALLDDKQRIMVIAIHNSDISDGWEREGENIEYFEQFSEKIAYPLGINIVFYLMTH
ncbi:MAG TPA: DUF4159 domain-containing protein [Opitutaceae bacterium]|nr:DUF4159 domain-containing protein [Opitutaceae bacterium]